MLALMSTSSLMLMVLVLIDPDVDPTLTLTMLWRRWPMAAMHAYMRHPVPKTMLS
jgi:hypothetical protein